jgi:hypothetical protein
MSAPAPLQSLQDRQWSEKVSEMLQLHLKYIQNLSEDTFLYKRSDIRKQVLSSVKR